MVNIVTVRKKIFGQVIYPGFIYLSIKSGVAKENHISFSFGDTQNFM